MSRPHIVILGAGFGGLYAYVQLRKQLSPAKAKITLVNKTNHFLFTPLIHEVATGGLSQHLVVESIRNLIRDGASFYQADIESIDLAHQNVKTTLGEIKYDYLVYALGASPKYYGIEGAKEYSHTLKSLKDATNIRSKIIDAFENATKIDNHYEKRKELSFVVVGGGATGVELVAEVSEFIQHTFYKFYGHQLDCKDVSLCLIHAGERILSQFDERMSKKAKVNLEKKDIRVVLNKRVNKVTDDGVYLDDGEYIASDLVLWAAGVQPNTELLPDGIERDKYNRIVVNQNLQVPGHHNIFVIGDASHTKDAKGEAFPMLAQVATRHGAHAAKNIACMIKGKQAKPFKYKLQGGLVSMGQWSALGVIHNFSITGMFAWFMWRTIYLFKFVSLHKKIIIALNWTINIFRPRDITDAE